MFSDADAGGAACGAGRPGGADRPAPVGESYLRADRILAAALDAGAEAIHPGYGFLSENPDFAEAVEAAGLAFIGPPAAAIRAMGLKDAAKRLMAQAGVPVVPGWSGEDQSPGRLLAEVERIGFPLLIKAVAGGGGKGMRLVERPEDFAAALAAAQGEARTAFGNAAVLIERYIPSPRHIEVQVFGDGTRAVHLHERDCSLQRRHQKVIEEAPAPGMTAAMRQAMGAAAVRAARGHRLSRAGTVEFIADPSDGLRPDRFWFMEMNTRLQVEHPVTEAVTGIDLVEWQLRVAAGEGLPLAQDAIPLSGHAVEARLYAEDVPAGFLPATGRIAHLRWPEGLRIETGVRQGDAISPWYDPMIAKIIAHGPTRAVALARLAQGLEATEVAGTVTNIAFLRRLLRHPDVRQGKVDTGLIGRDLAALCARAAPDAAVLAMAALAAAGLLDGEPEHAGFALWGPLRRTVAFGDGGSAWIETLGPGRHRIGTAAGEARVERRAGRWWVDDAPAPRAVRHSGGVSVWAGDGEWHVVLPDPLMREAVAAAGEGVLRAPMPGLVKALSVRAGARVRRGDGLAVLEAMKMEHRLTAPRDGVVEEVTVAEGDQVEAGAALMRIGGEAGDG
ncbi:3-methylcrotonoyl-CoA carboxylase, alpha subunit [Rubellimicrobium thermophilum DSM 16684]|uniref:3-methylcrotonoyl-CoA carboxylase, alpha subunit n=2 Tax=Rubellimicrobium TaxID=295418 RepID=S9RZ66_9RHOB|nr:3-methylcrotonoyl-CoA carboxylase, alpha subunit [Rubellimicrobium thermophilum DSM 16684]